MIFYTFILIILLLLISSTCSLLFFSIQATDLTFNAALLMDRIVFGIRAQQTDLQTDRHTLWAQNGEFLIYLEI